MPTKFIREHVQHRLFEWIMALNSFLTGMIILAFPDSVVASAFRHTIFVECTVAAGIGFMLCGAICLAVLILDARTTYWGPKIRAWSAIIRAIVWFQMEVSLVQMLFDTGNPSPAIANWLSLILGEVLAVYQAGRDVRKA